MTQDDEEVEMVADRVEREILIPAPAEAVWGAIAVPEQLVRWFCDAAEVDPRPGGEGTLTWNQRATNAAHTTVRVRVESADPPDRFSFRWDHPDGAEAREGNSLLVEFTLASEGEGTRVHLVESGFRALERPEERKQEYAEVHAKGWDVHLGHLRDYVVGR
jgi:uncharacterized protein YndB with AHSA1/START domain